MKNLKNEKGAITILVLVSILFMLSFLISTYVIIANKVQTQKEIINETKKTYETETAEEVYNNFFAGNIVPSILPEGYTEVEYLESTGTQWIDTGLISSADNKIYFDIDFEVNNISGNGADRNPIGSQNFAFNTYFLQVFLSKIYMFQGDINTEVTDLRNKVKFYKTNWYVNDELKNSSIGYPTSNCNIYLFKWGNNLSKNKLYKCNFFDEGENLLREFIPCYRKSDNKPGLYDLVSGVFYTNQGTGEFTYGNVAE